MLNEGGFGEVNSYKKIHIESECEFILTNDDVDMYHIWLFLDVIVYINQFDVIQMLFCRYESVDINLTV